MSDANDMIIDMNETPVPSFLPKFAPIDVTFGSAKGELFVLPRVLHIPVGSQGFHSCC